MMQDFEQQDDALGSPALLDRLNSMERIGLSDMERVALMDRVDTKYLLSQETLVKLLARVHSEYRILEVEGVCLSPYSTLYFDTPDRACYIQHHNKKLNRRKYRSRKYLSNGFSFFEIKTKSNKGRTKKRRISLDDIQETLSNDSTDFVQKVTGQLPDLKPVLWVNFSRFTLAHRERAERVTFDLGLEFSNEDGTGRHQLGEVVIAEIKQESDKRAVLIREELRNLRVRPMRISKYCIGSLMVDPSLKRNRFKVKLRAIEKITDLQKVLV